MKVLDKFNTTAQEWLQFLKQFSEEELQTKPAPTSWSLAELYDHIMKVARRYQIPNFKQSLTEDSVQKKGKNLIGRVIFDLKFLPRMRIAMENFPEDLVIKFTPELQTKDNLIADFEKFIKEVNELQNQLVKANKKQKHYHPMFGDINPTDWFSLMDIHFRHHIPQRTRIVKFLKEQKAIDS